MTHKLQPSTMGFPRTVLGYRIKTWRSGQAFKANIPVLPKTNVASKDFGRCIRDLYDKAETALQKLTVSGRVVPSRAFETSERDIPFGYHDAVASTIRDTNRLLNKYGFYVSGHHTHHQLTAARLAAEKVKQLYGEELPTDIAAYTEAENIIFESVFTSIWGLDRRAESMAGLFLKVDHLRKFSHLVEQAYISLYRQEPIAVMTTLVPVVEGILLSFYGFDLTSSSHSPDPERRLLNHLAAQWPSVTNFPIDLAPLLYDEYLRCFLWITHNIFYRDAQAAPGKGFFNRHYAAHLLGADDFCSRNNAFKMVALIDLLGHLIAVNVGQHDLFHTTNAEVGPRKGYYKLVAMQTLEEMKIKRPLFSQHMHHRPRHEYDWVPLGDDSV